jgi:hypothetical protein
LHLVAETLSGRATTNHAQVAVLLNLLTTMLDQTLDRTESAD